MTTGHATCTFAETTAGSVVSAGFVKTSLASEVLTKSAKMIETRPPHPDLDQVPGYSKYIYARADELRSCLPNSEAASSSGLGWPS